MTPQSKPVVPSLSTPCPSCTLGPLGYFCGRKEGCRIVASLADPTIKTDNNMQKQLDEAQEVMDVMREALLSVKHGCGPVGQIDKALSAYNKWSNHD